MVVWRAKAGGEVAAGALDAVAITIGLAALLRGLEPSEQYDNQ